MKHQAVCLDQDHDTQADCGHTANAANRTDRAPMSAPRGFADAAQTWNRRYTEAADSLLFGAAPNAWLATQAPRLKPGGRWLSVADGEGRNSVWLARQGLKVDAFDIADVAVAKARAFAAAQGVTVDYAVAGVDDLAWPEALYDGVAAIFVQFADPAMRQRLFNGLVRALKPGGLLLLQGYTPRQLDYRTGGPGQIAHLYTPAQLRQELAALQIEELREYDDDLAEGSAHRGRSALVGLVARKP